jgi:beta-glucosidase
VRELQAFARVTLEPGAGARVTFEVPVAALGFTGRDLRYVVEPGDIEFFVGTSAVDLRHAGTLRLVGDGPVAAVRTTQFRSTVAATARES